MSSTTNVISWLRVRPRRRTAQGEEARSRVGRSTRRRASRSKDARRLLTRQQPEPTDDFVTTLQHRNANAPQRRLYVASAVVLWSRQTTRHSYSRPVVGARCARLCSHQLSTNVVRPLVSEFRRSATALSS